MSDCTPYTSTKQCSKCKEIKPATKDYFWRAGSGFRSNCKICAGCQKPVPAPDGYRRCTRCLVEHPSTNEYFHVSKGKKGGLSETCKKCKTKADRVYYIANRERLLQYQSALYEANSEQLNKERKERYNNTKAETHEKRLARSRKWRADNKERYRLIRRTGEGRRRARKYNLPNAFSIAEWERCLTYFCGCCAACDRPLNGLFHTVHADHWIPLISPACPGTVPGNMVPLCGGGIGSCNLSKGDKDAIEWLTDHFGKRKAKTIQKKVDDYFEWVKQFK